MKTRPWPIVLLAGLQLLTPVSNLTLTYLLFGQGPVSYISNSFEANPIFFLWDFFGVYLVLSYAIYACKLWSYPAFMSGVLWNVVRTFQAHAEFPNETPLYFLFPVIALNLILVTYFLIPNVKSVFFESKLRWWESNPRYRTDIPCDVFYKNKRHKMMIKDMSQRGVGLQGKLKLKAWDEVFVYFRFYGREVFARALVIHAKEGATTTLTGVYFSGLDAKNQAALKHVVRALMHLGAERTLEVPSQRESFKSWVKSVLRGQELVPVLPSLQPPASSSADNGQKAA